VAEGGPRRAGPRVVRPHGRGGGHRGPPPQVTVADAIDPAVARGPVPLFCGVRKPPLFAPGVGFGGLVQSKRGFPHSEHLAETGAHN
jgi:hypothetical protein